MLASWMPHGFDWASLMMTWEHLGHYFTTWGQLGDDLGMTWALLWQNLERLWHTLAHSGILWSTLLHSGILWHTLSYSGLLWHTLAYSCILWHTLAYSDILWHTLAYSGILWHALAYSGIINASLITADGAYHCPVGSIWPFLFISIF